MRDKLVVLLNYTWNFICNQRKTLLAASFLVIVGVGVWGIVQPNIARAEAPTTETASLASPPTEGGFLSREFWIGLFVEILLGLARLCLSVTLFILTFIIQLAGYNGYLDSSAVTVGWVMIRDITNMGFVVILLVIAFGTILGLEHYEWKKMLVKLVLAAILVNFSRTICGIFIDIAQVIMTTFVNGIAATAGGNLIKMFNLDSIRDLSTNASSDPASFTPINFFIAAVMALVFSSIVMFTMGIFLFMLLARMLVLWVLIVLSPLAFVLSVLPQTQSYADEWWHEFGANVITGPVLLFFVWLSFVTVGNGKINEEIADPNNNISAAANGDEADALAGQSSGLGKAMDWNNMANFAIAIGMLVVGSRVASQLGGIGGDWAGQAVDFGKKVGMVASGAMAARWAVGKVGEGAGAAGKFALMKAPGIGGEAWERRAGTVAGWAKDKWIRNVQLPRDKTARAVEDANAAKQSIKKIMKSDKTLSYDQAKAKLGDKEKKALESVGKMTMFLGSGLIETDKRKNKRLEDLKGANENLEHTWEENLSTSNSWQGQLKLLTGIEKHAAERMAEGKRKQKYAEKTMEIMNDHHKPKNEQNKDYALFHAMEENADKALAIGENIEGVINRQMEVNVAKERDNQLIKQGKTPRFLEQTTAKHAKEDLELAGSSDFDRTMGKIEFLRDRAKDIRQKLGTPGLSAQDKEKHETDLNNTLMDLASVRSFSESRGAIFGTSSTAAALKGTGFGTPAGADQIYAQAANELASVLQKQVVASEDGVNAALVEMEKQMGDKYQAFMQTFSAGLAKSADEGAINKAGLFREKAARDSSGKVIQGKYTYSVADIGTAAAPGKDAEWSAGKREYALSQAKASRIEGFNGMVDQTPAGKVTITSPEAQKRVADVFGVVTTNMVNNVSKQNIDTFNEAFESMAKTEVEDLIAAMRSRAKDAEGIVALLKRTNLTKKFGPIKVGDVNIT